MSTAVLKPRNDKYDSTYQRQFALPKSNSRRPRKTFGMKLKSKSTRSGHRRTKSCREVPPKPKCATKQRKSKSKSRNVASHKRRHSHFTITRTRQWTARSISMDEPTLNDDNENVPGASRRMRHRRSSTKASGLRPKPFQSRKDTQVREMWTGLEVGQVDSTKQQVEGSCTPEGQLTNSLSTTGGRTEGETRGCSGFTAVDVFVDDGKIHQSQRELLMDNLASILTQLCDAVHVAYKNDDEGIKRVTRKYAAVFSSTSIYKNLREFLQQLSDEARFENACLVNVLVYVSRLLRKRNFVITWFSIHRIILTCVMLADKSISDIHTSTAKYAWVTGTQKVHMTMMERRLLRCLKYETVIFEDRHKRAQEYLLNTSTFTPKMPVL